MYERLIATNPAVERKGASMPYTSVNGHMFTFLTESGSLLVRLPGEARDAFMERHNTTLGESHGTVLKEYVAVPDSLLEKTEELHPFFDLSYEYVKALKPKPTKRAR
jgi:TfoX/Sxy family transcriptional regulator of competence genes